ncbi:hypothetical protein BCL90_0856 [Pedobacter alluvionis]|uniref:Uncharacterized protein n=1 Tax=Pedobacter alluvionis TaxID=475253 RepID=A0A497YBQ6_9SPHI|nr:hypothetical protein BCL90_0856 [Pedobacter alluvionis]
MGIVVIYFKIILPLILNAVKNLLTMKCSNLKILHCVQDDSKEEKNPRFLCFRGKKIYEYLLQFTSAKVNLPAS